MMPRFKISSTLPCYVTWQTVIEAESLDALKAKFPNGTYPFDQAPEIGDAVSPLASTELEIEELD